MVIARFFIEDKFRIKDQFFKKTFLVVNTNIKVVLEILFFLLSNANVDFSERGFIWKSYTTAKVLPTTSQIWLIDKYEFTNTIKDENL